MATPPVVPPVPDADRYYATTLVVLTNEISVPFPVYGDAEDLRVILDGTELAQTDYGFYSASGATALPIVDGRLTFPTALVGSLEVIGNWQPRQLAMATAPGVGRREFNQVVGTLVSGMREQARAIRDKTPTALIPDSAGPLSSRPDASSVAQGYIFLQTDDASGRIVYYVAQHIGVSGNVWSAPVYATGPKGDKGDPGANGLDGSTTGTLRNRLVNPSFQINTREYVSGVALSAGVYAHDRWKAGASGCTYTFTPTKPDTQITILAGTLKQIVPPESVEGGNYVLSWTGTATARVNGGSYAASPIAVTGLTAGVAISIEVSTGTFSKPQFEPGTTQSAFERRPLQYEEAVCEKHCRWLPVGASGLTGAGYLNTHSITFPKMYAVPNVGAVVADPNLPQSTLNLTSYAIASQTPYSAYVNATATAGGAYAIYGYRALAEAEL